MACHNFENCFLAQAYAAIDGDPSAKEAFKQRLAGSQKFGHAILPHCGNCETTFSVYPDGYLCAADDNGDGCENTRLKFAQRDVTVDFGRRLPADVLPFERPAA